VNGLLIVLGSIGIPALLLIVSVLCFTISDFSRSVLEEVAEERENSERFVRILRDHERARLSCELLRLILLAASGWILTTSGVLHTLFSHDPLNTGMWVPLLIRICGGIVSLFVLLVAVPWCLARVCGEWMLFRGWPLLETAGVLFRPAWALFCRMDRIAHRVCGLPEPLSRESTNLLTDELRAVVDEGQRNGVLQHNASRMIHRVVDLQSEDVAAIMTPRTEMVTIPAGTVLAAALPLLVEQGYSRVPVVGRTVDDVVGILYARDLLAASVSLQSELNRRSVESIAREVFFVPESQGIGNLLEKMKQQKVHMAIVVDEYSGVSGLVTLEDIIEEIVGDISDEYDDEQQAMMTTAPSGVILADARLHIDDLNRELGLELPEDEDFDTVGGFMMSVLGHIPVQGEVIETHGVRFRIVQADERRVHQVEVTVTGETGVNAEEAGHAAG
jgi:CBS domain containing-hemolysin-like protein